LNDKLEEQVERKRQERIARKKAGVKENEKKADLIKKSKDSPSGVEMIENLEK